MLNYPKDKCEITFLDTLILNPVWQTANVTGMQRPVIDAKKDIARNAQLGLAISWPLIIISKDKTPWTKISGYNACNVH